MFSRGYNHLFSPKQKRILDEKRLTVSQKDASDKSSSDNLAVMLYSDAPSDLSSDAYSDDLYSVVMNSDLLHSSIVIEWENGPVLYTAVVPARRIITAPEQSLNRACRGILARRQTP